MPWICWRWVSVPISGDKEPQPEPSLRLPFRQESEDMMMFQGYDQQTVERSDLGFGVVETIQQGVDGTQQLTEEITYVNGVQTAAEVVHIDILTPAVPEITARGTHLAPGMTAELDGHTFIWPVPVAWAWANLGGA